MDGRSRKILVRDLNSHLICTLCGGYYIEATAISVCLHTFCKSCIVKYLETNKFCPICDVQLHSAKPLLSLRPDKMLQRLVYKMIPGLYSNEMQRKRQFYSNTEIESSTDTDVSCDQALALQDQQRPGTVYYSPEDSISLSLEYYISGKKNADEKSEENEDNSNKQIPPRRYLQCPAGVKMHLLKKFLRTKYSLAPDYKVDIIYADECLPDEFSLMDVAYTFMWNRATPMRLSYRILERTTVSVPATYMGPASSPQPTLTSDAPDATHQPSTRSTTNLDASSKGQQIYGDKRRLRESDSEAEITSHSKGRTESRYKEKSEPPIKKLRINSKNTEETSKKKNNSLKSSDKSKSALNSESKKANKNIQQSECLVSSNSTPSAKEQNDNLVPAQAIAEKSETKKTTDKSKEKSDYLLEMQDEFVVHDQQMETDDLEEDDEDRLRISASEEDNTQEAQDVEMVVEDAVEEVTPEPIPEPEVPKKTRGKQIEEATQPEKKEGSKRDEKEVAIKVKRKKEKKAQKDKERRPHHHHHDRHRHHDRNWDHSDPPSATILHSPDMKNDIMKLKVKITPVKPDEQSKYYHRYNNHSPTRHHNSKHKTAYIVSEENGKASKNNVSNTDDNSRNSSPSDEVIDEKDAEVKTQVVSESYAKQYKQADVNSLTKVNNYKNSNKNSGNVNHSAAKCNSNDSNCKSNSGVKNSNNNNNNDNNNKNGTSTKDTVKNHNEVSVSLPNKEKLLQMRAVRHKSVSSPKEIAPNSSPTTDGDIEEDFDEDYSDDVEEIKPTSTILIPPSSITVSKITAAEKKKMEEEKLLMMSGKHNGNGLDSKRPSLEIMLVNAPSSKNNLKHSSQDEKSSDKFKSMKSAPPSIPLARIPKSGTQSLLASNRHPVTSHNKTNHKLNKSSALQNTNKDGRPKQGMEEERRMSQEKLSVTLTKSKNSSSQDDFGALDLSDKSSRKGSSSASSTSSENSNCPSPNNVFSSTQNHRQYTPLHGSPGNMKRSPSSSPPQPCNTVAKKSADSGLTMFPPSMRNLKTLSDTAAHIRDMMAARDVPKGQLSSSNNHSRSPQRFLSDSPPKHSPNPRGVSSSTQLNIPTPSTPLNNKLMNRARIGGIPNLNEITPGSVSNIARGKSNIGLQNSLMSMSKPGQNQTVRHIPNPSALLFRQHNQLKSMNSSIASGSTSPNKKPAVNGRGPNMPPPPPAIPLSSLRRMESMTRNIEKVAAGLSVKAAVEAGYGSVK